MKLKPAAVFSDGVVINADCLAGGLSRKIRSFTGGQVPLVYTDPPYGNIVDEEWDKVDDQYTFVAWMLKWSLCYGDMVLPQGAFYVWGGIGKPGFRPFFRYLYRLEEEAAYGMSMASLITWSKKRAYGVQNNYLFTREELAYFCKGDPKKPRCFNIPLLEEKRGYAGYDARYPAKSEYLRRTNVWTDITELFRGKVHPTEKPSKLAEVVIGVHTQPGEWVIDPFAGSGSTGVAARALGRKFVLVEKDPQHYATILGRLKDNTMKEIVL